MTPVPRWPMLLALGGCAQAALSFLAAVWLYPGGTMLDRGARGYIFFENAFSDLGLTQVHSGAANPAAWIFNPSVFLLGLCLLPMFRRLALSVPQPRRPRLWLALGTLSPLGMAGVGLTPFDLALHGHNLALVCWLLPLALLLALHTRALRRSPNPTRGACWPALLLGAILALHLAEGAYLMTRLYLTGGTRPAAWIWVATVTTQKAMVLAFLIFVHYWALKMLSTRILLPVSRW